MNLPDLENQDIFSNIEAKTKREAVGRPDVKSVVFVNKSGTAQERYQIGNDETFVTVPVAFRKLTHPGIEIDLD